MVVAHHRLITLRSFIVNFAFLCTLLLVIILTNLAICITFPQPPRFIVALTQSSDSSVKSLTDSQVRYSFLTDRLI